MSAPATKAELEGLLPYANPRQALYIKALIQHGNQRVASEALGCHQSSISTAVTRVRYMAARQGYAPEHDMTKPAAPGFSVSGTSTLYGPDGDVKAQWVKTKLEDQARAEAMREFVEELCATVKPRKPVAGPKRTESDLLVGYPIGDHHWGLYSHAAETGADYDLNIAKDQLASAVDYLVDRSPASERALLANLGDYFHIDNRSNKTPASGHVLDVDTRYSKVIRLASFGLAHAIERLLRKHKTVHVVNVPGNHDQDSASWLALVMEAWFRNEPRVTVETSPSPFLFYQFGMNMICMTHGHTIKLEEIPGTMAAHQPEMWGTTKYRVAWCGHVHHASRLSLKEYRAAKVETFGVLPPNDSYGISRGFLSQREMHAITFKKSGGELGRTTYNADLV